MMEKLAEKLQSSKQRGVLEEAITSIAVIAAKTEGEFANYYPHIMPVLKRFVLTATGEKEHRLRGKAFECISHLGLAVGKEKFAADAQEAMQAMYSNVIEADDVQKEYIKDASERIYKCLGEDFAKFLPPLLQQLYQTLDLKSAVENTGVGVSGDPGVVVVDEESGVLSVQTEDGRILKVKTAKIEELESAAQ